MTKWRSVHRLTGSFDSLQDFWQVGWDLAWCSAISSPLPIVFRHRTLQCRGYALLTSYQSYSRVGLGLITLGERYGQESIRLVRVRLDQTVEAAMDMKTGSRSI